MSHRTILRASQHSNSAARELLALMFAAELLNPSTEFWVAMAWVSDVSLFESAYSEFDALVPNLGSEQVLLSDALTEMARRGSTVNIVTRPDPSNERFVEAVRRKASRTGVLGRIRVGISENIHQKNLVGKSWFTDGSMNLTVNGLDHNVESLTVYFDPQSASEIRTKIRLTWSGILRVGDDQH